MPRSAQCSGAGSSSPREGRRASRRRPFGPKARTAPGRRPGRPSRSPRSPSRRGPSCRFRRRSPTRSSAERRLRAPRPDTLSACSDGLWSVLPDGRKKPRHNGCSRHLCKIRQPARVDGRLLSASVDEARGRRASTHPTPDGLPELGSGDVAEDPQPDAPLATDRRSDGDGVGGQPRGPRSKRIQRAEPPVIAYERGGRTDRERPPRPLRARRRSPPPPSAGDGGPHGSDSSRRSGVRPTQYLRARSRGSGRRPGTGRLPWDIPFPGRVGGSRPRPGFLVPPRRLGGDNFPLSVSPPSVSCGPTAAARAATSVSGSTPAVAIGPVPGTCLAPGRPRPAPRGFPS